jgi:hypothetical protein
LVTFLFSSRGTLKSTCVRCISPSAAVNRADALTYPDEDSLVLQVDVGDG